MSLLKKQSLKTAATASVNFLHYQKLIAALLVLALVMLVAKVYFSNQLAVSGARVSYSNSKLSELTSEKYNLENQLSAKSSLSYIDAKARELGLVKINKVEVLQLEPGVAFNQ